AGALPGRELHVDERLPGVGRPVQPEAGGGVDDLRMTWIDGDLEAERVVGNTARLVPRPALVPRPVEAEAGERPARERVVAGEGEDRPAARGRPADRPHLRGRQGVGDRMPALPHVDAAPETT